MKLYEWYKNHATIAKFLAWYCGTVEYYPAMLYMYTFNINLQWQRKKSEINIVNIVSPFT